MGYPRLGTPAGDRAMASAQRIYDNMTPDDDDDEEPPTLYVCECADDECRLCDHKQEHEHSESCRSCYCHFRGKDVECLEV